MSLRDRMGSLSRRDWLKLSAAGVSATCWSGWLNVLAAHAAAPASKPAGTPRSCIVLWMDGGPSHKDTFDLKPGTRDGGEFQPIKTSVPGIEISEHWPKVAQVMHLGAIVRSMSTSEGAHPRARYLLHTGYREGLGGVVYPSLGSIVSRELGRENFPLPNFVAIGNRSYGSGFLGARHQPLVVNDPTRGVENLRPLVGEGQFDRRVGLLDELETAFHKNYQAASGAAHQTTYQRAVALMRSREARAFDLGQESAATRAAYGGSRFGDGCLLARRLIETGVRFVEVTLGGWDTHQDNFTRVKNLSAQVDPALSALVSDLKTRGLLDSTLVIWMGEFGRTPKINSRGAKPGRDHYPKAWSTVFFGGGIKPGQVIGKTDAEGAKVVDRPVTTPDFMATVCQSLGIDWTKKYTAANNRPVRIADKDAEPISELVG